jgi:RNA polymerase sigma factor (sigma-70 family)
MYRAHARFDPAGNFAGWARRIATNLALDHLRKARREVPLDEDFASPPAPDAGAQREARERIALAFRTLSPKLRVVATLALLEDVPHREIAEALGISEAAVRVRAFRATRILREELKDLVAEYERAK